MIERLRAGDDLLVNPGGGDMSMEQVASGTAAVVLDKGFGGQLVDPSHPAYDSARAIWNGMVDKRPALIARCGTSADVAAVVNHARENELPLTAPPADFVPAELRGQPALGMAMMYAGDPDEGETIAKPLRALRPAMDGIRRLPYVEFQAILDATAPPGQRNYARGEFLPALPDEAIDTFVAHVHEPISPFSQMIIFRVGGAINRVAEDATAAGHRDSEYLMHPITVWENTADDDRQITHNRALCAAMKPFTSGGVYVNFTSEDEPANAYHGEKRDRLVTLKRRYDPDNLFRLNQNIKPS